MKGKYNILVVDDEAFARNLVSGLLINAADKYTVVSECHNGETALESLKKKNIDIVITDIKMPVMDGIEFIEKALLYKPELKIIVLTAYNDFELVRKCFTLGAVNYIMKTEIDFEKLITVLDDTVNKTADNSDKLKTMAENLIGNKYVNNELVEKMTAEGFDLKGRNVRIIDIKIHNFQKLLSEKWGNDEMFFSYGINNILKEIVADYPISCISYYKYNGEFVALISLNNIRSEQEFLRFVHELFKILEKNVKILADIRINMGISSYFVAPKTYNDLYHEALTANSMNFFNDKSNYVFFQKKYEDSKEESDFSDITSAFSRLFEAFSDLPPQVLPKVNVRDNMINVHNMKFLKASVEKMYYKVTAYCAESGITGRLSKELEFYRDYLKNEADLSELMGWLGDIYEKISLNVNNDTGLVWQIKRYIEENENKQPMLIDFAVESGMSPVYLSRVFKKATGINFADYVTNHKIKKAIEYMKTTDMNITEISYTLGYANVETFSRAFKRTMNQNPKSYLKSLKK